MRRFLIIALVTFVSCVGAADFGAFRGVAFGGGRFVAVSNDAGTATSTDGKNWDYATSSSTFSLALFDVVYVNDAAPYFLAVGTDWHRMGYRPISISSP